MISVLTPSFNYGVFIEDSIQSVRKQRGVVFEHIIEDNLSTDSTSDVVMSYPHVKWRSQSDRGQSDALNKALLRASGSWVSWLNADEFYLPNGLQHLRMLAEQYDVDVVFGDVVLIDRDGRLIRLLAQHKYSEFVLRKYDIFMPTCATLFRREILDDNCWDINLRRIMDWDLVLRLAMNGRKFMHAPCVVGAFRVHDQRITAAPASDHYEEYATLDHRYGLGLTNRRVAGRLAHSVLKIRDGAYRRQVRSARFSGADLRWFSSESACRSVRSLQAACYRE